MPAREWRSLGVNQAVGIESNDVRSLGLGRTETVGDSNQLTKGSGHMTTTAEERQLNELPESMRIAQGAVKTQEVQEIMKQLAKYNLGVCMPHMHVREGEFAELPADIISLEQKSAFIPTSDADPVNTLPVAWRWQNNAVIIAGSCHIIRKRCGK